MRASAAHFDDASDPLLALEAAAEQLGWACLRAEREELLLSAGINGLAMQLSAQWLRREELLQVGRGGGMKGESRDVGRRRDEKGGR